jgi:hypothetical protein
MDLLGGAAAGAQSVAKVSARTRIHGRDELESGGEFCLSRGSGDGDGSGLHGFAEAFQGPPIELRQFIQKQYAIV